jgi:hypothetical protein
MDATQSETTKGRARVDSIEDLRPAPDLVLLPQRRVFRTTNLRTFESPSNDRLHSLSEAAHSTNFVIGSRCLIAGICESLPIRYPSIYPNWIENPPECVVGPRSCWHQVPLSRRLESLVPRPPKGQGHGGSLGVKSLSLSAMTGVHGTWSEGRY